MAVWANIYRGLSGWPGYDIGISGMTDHKRRLVKIIAPAEVIMLAEHDGTPFPANGLPYANWTDAPFVRTPVDGGGKALTPPASWGSPVGTWPWNEANWLGFALRVSHRGRSNYAFHDGRVASLDPWQTSSADPSLPNMWTGVQ
jgi:prepilin-type processing-associated H-X9-DG protein